MHINAGCKTESASSSIFGGRRSFSSRMQPRAHAFEMIQIESTINSNQCPSYLPVMSPRPAMGAGAFVRSRRAACPRPARNERPLRGSRTWPLNLIRLIFISHLVAIAARCFDVSTFLLDLRQPFSNARTPVMTRRSANTPVHVRRNRRGKVSEAADEAETELEHSKT